MKDIFRALKYRNYRSFFVGQAISVIGTWMQQTAMSWLVYRITNSPWLLGTTAFFGQIPNLILAPFAGVFVDRFNKHKIVILTQTLALIQALILSILTLSGVIQVWHIILMNIFLGVVNSVDAPARQSFVVEMVDRKEDLANAIALNSFIFNSARLIGPTISGFVVALLGEGICFLINAISYLAVIIALLFMRLKPKKSIPTQNNILQNLKEGFVYSFKFLVVRYTLIYLSICSMVASFYQVLMPVFAGKVFHGGPQTLGFLMGALGIGTLIGALYVAGRKSILGIERNIAYSLVFMGLGLILFSISKTFILSFLLLILIGFTYIINVVSSNTLVQTVIDDEIRGRVMSFYVMFFMGAMPIGSFLGGALGNIIGPSYTVLLGGIICLLSFSFYYSRLSLLNTNIQKAIKKRDFVS